MSWSEGGKAGKKCRRNKGTKEESEAEGEVAGVVASTTPLRFSNASREDWGGAVEGRRRVLKGDEGVVGEAVEEKRDEEGFLVPEPELFDFARSHQREFDGAGKEGEERTRTRHPPHRSLSKALLQPFFRDGTTKRCGILLLSPTDVERSDRVERRIGGDHRTTRWRGVRRATTSRASRRSVCGVGGEGGRARGGGRSGLRGENKDGLRRHLVLNCKELHGEVSGLVSRRFSQNGETAHTTPEFRRTSRLQRAGRGRGERARTSYRSERWVSETRWSRRLALSR